jgi:hypothetical protein
MPRMPKPVTAQFYLDWSEKQALKNVCYQLDTNYSRELRRMVREFLAANSGVLAGQGDAYPLVSPKGPAELPGSGEERASAERKSEVGNRASP